MATSLTAKLNAVDNGAHQREASGYALLLCAFPFPYISKGLLMDLTPLFAEDPELALDDLVIANALTAQGSMYVASGEFFFETLVGLPSRFGNQYGWTLQDYLQNQPSQMIFKRSQHDQRGLSERDSGTLHTDGCGLGEWTLLFRLRRLYRNSASKCPNSRKPESASGISFATAIRSWKGKWVAALSWVNTVWKLAYEEKMAGCALSFIGWPTIDGSCGSDIILTDPVGIVAQSEHTDGSWTFIKYMIQNTEESDQNGLPVYRPLLETMCEAAKEDSALPVKFRDTDQETFV